jgi:hypothetical protein
MSFRSVRHWFLLFALVLLVSVAQTELLLLAFKGSQHDQIIDATAGVATGHPHWRIYQNRVLGPELFWFLVNRGISQADAFIIACCGLLSTFYGVLAACAWNLTRRMWLAVSAVLLGFALNAIMMQPPWIYLWDLIDLTVFTILTWAVLTRQPLWVFSVTIAAALFNREVMLIVALLLSLDGAVSFARDRQRRHLAQLLTGAVLAVGGYYLVEFLRDALLVREVGPELYGFTQGPHFDFTLEPNWQTLLHTPLRTHFLNLPQYAFIIAVVVVAAWHWNKQPRLAIGYSILWTSVICFGVANEWRVWIEFVPFLTLSVLSYFEHSTEKLQVLPVPDPIIGMPD